MPMCASSVVLSMSACIIEPTPYFGDLLFVFDQFYQSMLECFVRKPRTV